MARRPNRLFEKLPHLSLLAVALTALWGITQTLSIWSGSPSALAIIGIPSQLGDTIVIGGLNLNEAIGADISALTELHLASLEGGHASTLEGSSRYHQTLRLAQTGTDAFTSGTIQYTQDDAGAVGDFLVFSYTNPLFEYEIQFDQGLESQVENGRLPGLEDSSFAIMGAPATLYRASVTGNSLEIRLFTSQGDMTIRDSDATDSAFEKGIKINGKSVNAQARLTASITSTSVRMTRIALRVLSYTRHGGDMHVPPMRGVRQHLRESETLLNPSFDIIFAGVRGRLEDGTGTRTSGLGGAGIIFEPVGGQRYDLLFTNLAGQTIRVPYVTLVSGTPQLGNGKQDFIVSEGGSTTDYNIDPGDYFVITTANDWNGISNIAVYAGVSRDDHALYFDFLSGGRTTATYDPSTGRARLTISGVTHDVYVDTGSTERIVVDQNNDGSFSGTTARIVTAGSAQVQPGATTTTLRIARRLFDNPPASDETTTLNFAEDDSKITAQVPSQSSLTMRHGNDRISRGMTNYGVRFTLDDRRSPSRLSIDIPRGQATAKVAVQGFSSRSRIGRVPKGGQAGGLVVITFERERFLPKGKGASSGAGVGVND